MICHHYKCIFVHIPKNAGQSIEHVFLKLLSLTWETRAPLLLRYNDTPEIGPPRLAHLKAGEYVRYQYLTQKMFDEYYKFAFVRNPWSRIVSIYKYYGFDKRCEFNSFLNSIFKNKIFKKQYWFVGPQSEFLYDKNGNLLVDFIGRFESLQKDFDDVCQGIGLSPTELPHVNRAKDYDIAEEGIPAFKNYQDYFNDESREFIAEIYKSDIELFGYDFAGTK